MTVPLKVLLIEDCEADARLVLYELQEAGFDPQWQRVDTEAGYLAALDPSLDLILSDFHIPGWDTMEALALLQARGWDIPFIIVSGNIGEETAVAAMRCGAADYLLKDRLARLGPAVKQALEAQRLREEKRTIDAVHHTERQRAETALRASEERYRHLIQFLPAALYTCDAAGRVSLFNEAAAALWGREPVIGQDPWCGSWKIFEPDGRPLPPEDCPMAVAMREGCSIRGREIVVERPDGSRRHVLPHPDPIRDASGVVIGAINMLVDITERKEAELAIRESEMFARSTLDALSAHLAILNSTGCIIAVNRAWRDFAAANPPLAANVCEGANYLAICETTRGPEESRAAVIAAGIRSVMRGAEPEFVHEYACHSPTERRWFIARVTRFPGPGPVRVVVAHENITGRRRAEESLRRAESNYRSIFDHAQDGIYQMTPEGKFLTVNPALARILGYASADELMAERVDITQQGYTDPGRRAEFKRLLERDGVVINFEYEAQCQDGRRKWVQANVRTVRLGQGRVLYYEGTLKDISEQRRAEAALRESEEKFSNVFRNSPNAILITRFDGTILDVNDSFTRLTGFIREETLGRTTLEIGFWAQPASRENFVHELQINERVANIESRVRHRSGQERSVLVSAEVMALAGERVIIGEVLDITERKRTEELLAWEKSALELMASPAPLAEILSAYTLGLERQLPGTLCSILLLDAEEGRLRHGAGPSLPPEYNALIDGVTIGPKVGSCGTAAYLNEQIIVADIATDPLWADYRALALEHGLRACWSTPIRTGQRKVLGTFAVYFREPRQPLPAELDLVDRVEHIVSLAIEHKQAEIALRAEKTFSDLLVESLPGLVYLFGHDGQPLRWNRALETVLEYTGAEVAQRKTLDFVAAEDHERAQQSIAATLTTGFGEIELTVLTKFGKRLPYLLTSHRIMVGDQPCVLGVGLDLSHRRRTEEQVRHLASFPELNPNPVLEFDQDGALTYFNPAALEMAQQAGHPELATLLPPETSAIVAECLASGHPRLRLETKHGKHTLSWSFYPIATGRVVHCYVGDISQRLQLEEQFRQSQKMEAIGQLAGGVAHDFNNILAAMMMQAELCSLIEHLPSDAGVYLNDLKASAERAANLTRQLLAFSRRQVMQTRPLDLNETVTSLARMLQRILGEDVNLQLNLHPRPLLTRADAGMLDQVLMNLVVNARDAMPRGGRLIIETGETSLTAEEAQLIPDATAGRHVRLGVTDTGTGITPENLLHIFEPFFTTKDQGQGTGLGLATVFGIVKQHGGWLRVDSTIGRGTTFEIFLRAGPASEAPLAVAAVKAWPRGGTETILVVEDEPAVRMLTRVVLERQGYRVLEAATGVEALEIWEQHQATIQLLFTDIVMPEGVNGRELATRLQARQPQLRVIFTSGYSADIAGRELSLQEGQNFVQKPCSPRQLLEAVRRCLDQ